MTSRLDQAGTVDVTAVVLQVAVLLQEEAMEKARTGLRKTMRRLNRTYEQSKSNHILYLLLFAVGVFILMYSWLKFYRLVKWLF